MQYAVLGRDSGGSLPLAWSTNRRNWTVLAVFVFGTLCALFAAFVVYHKQSLFSSAIDVNGFGLLSRNLALGDGLSLGYGPSIRRAPLYPAFGALLLKLFGGASPDVPDAIAYQSIIVVQCLLFGLTCVLTFVTAQRLFGPRVALIAALLCPLVPQSLRYVGQTEVETLMGLLIALLAYTGLRLVERPDLRNGAWFGLTAAAATLTKPVTQLYPVAFLALAWLVWYGWRLRRSEPPTGSLPLRAHVRASLAVLVFFALPILPWLVRNWAVTDGQFIGISSNAPGETLRGYVAVQPQYVLLGQNFGDWDPEANAYEEDLLAAQGSQFYHWNAPRDGTMEVTPSMPVGVASAVLDAQKDRIESAAVSDRMLHRPVEFVTKFMIQLATFWYLVVDRSQSLAMGVSALVVLGLAAMGLVRARRQSAPVWPVLAIIVYSNLIYAATLAMARYSMPLYPTLMMFTAAGLAWLVAWVWASVPQPLEPRPATPSGH